MLFQSLRTSNQVGRLEQRDQILLAIKQMKNKLLQLLQQVQLQMLIEH